MNEADEVNRAARPGASIALLPLDERPVCVKLPAMVAAVARVEVRTPSSGMPRMRTPGDPHRMAAWLAEAGTGAEAAVVSLETLGYGGLIASRTQPGDAATVASRWQCLARLAEAGVAVHAVTLVTRAPDSADATEEPDYWDPHGPALHRLSARLHRGDEAGIPQVPEGVRADFLARRLRNHVLNLAALELMAHGTLSSLVVGADDTAVDGLATAELEWLRRWAGWLGAGDAVAVRPGADEACTTLVAKAVGALMGGTRLRVAVEAVDPAGLERVAPYENTAVGHTAAGQVEACGGRVVPAGDRCDLVLLVHTPDGSGTDWALAPPARRAPGAGDRAEQVAKRAAELVASGRPVAIGDCAQPNGADPLLVGALRARGLPERLAGYAAWNTAGNTLGTAAAHALTAVAARRAGRFDHDAHRRLLLHRFLEDWGYMTHARQLARRELGSDPARHERAAAGRGVLAVIEGRLRACRRTLGSFPGLDLAEGSVRLPWNRTFEADFEVRGTPAVGDVTKEAPR